MAFRQGHGSTPGGLALARCVDPDSKSIDWETFGVAMGVMTPVNGTAAITDAGCPPPLRRRVPFSTISGGLDVRCHEVMES